MFPEAVVFEAVDTEFSSVDCLLVALLVLVDKFKIGLNCNMCPPVVLQFSMHGEFSHVVDCTVDLVG